MKCANCALDIDPLFGLTFAWCRHDKVYLCRKWNLFNKLLI